MNILCIDPAWSGPTGYVRYFPAAGGSSDFCGSYGTMKATEVNNWIKRFDLFENITHLVIEDTFFSVNVKSYGLLCRAKQIWISDAIDHFSVLPENIFEVSPQTWQKGLQRNWRFGGGSKKNMPEIEQYIKQRWGLKNTKLTDHEISAFGLLTWFIDNKRA